MMQSRDWQQAILLLQLEQSCNKFQMENDIL